MFDKSRNNFFLKPVIRIGFFVKDSSIADFKVKILIFQEKALATGSPALIEIPVKRHENEPKTPLCLVVTV